MSSDLFSVSWLDLDSIPSDEEVCHVLRSLEPPGLPSFPCELQIEDENGVRRVPVDRDALRLGSAPDNDVVVPGVEPHHLRVWRFAFGLMVARHSEECSLQVISALGQVREPPINVNSGLFTAGDVVRIGSVTLTAELRDDEAPPEGDFEGIVGRSLMMARLYLLITRTAPTNLSVLIQGANGTGKEAVAHAIHRRSQRASGPFVTLDCTGLTAELLNDQLFGHEKGAFTGANEGRPGRFETAHGGTLFLDEIGDLPLAFQATFLRVLQSGEMTRLGSNEARKVDVRIVAATNADLEQAVLEGRFREDLYFRLAGMPVFVPPLIHRRRDIPRLARFFLNRENKGDTRIELSDEALELLLNHSWRGNVRELEGVIGRALVHRWGQPVIKAVDIQFNGSVLRAAEPEAAAPVKLDPNRWLDLRGLPLAEAIKQVKLRAIHRHGGNKSAAAIELDVSRTTLRGIGEKDEDGEDGEDGEDE